VTSITDLVSIQKSENKLASIAALKKLGGIELAVARTKIKTAILDLFEYYGESITPQSFNTVNAAFEKKGYMLTGADLILFFDNCKNGKYKNRVETIDGKEFRITFFRLTPNVFIEWLLVYLDERIEAFEAMQTKPDLAVSQTQVEILKTFADINLKKFPKPKLEEVEEIQPKHDVWNLQKELQKFVDKEFHTNRLIDRQGDWEEIPYAMFGEKRLMQSEYVAARFNQIFENLTAEHSQLETEISLTDFLTTKVKEIIQ